MPNIMALNDPIARFNQPEDVLRIEVKTKVGFNACALHMWIELWHEFNLI